MLMATKCPACGFTGNVPATFRGKQVKCRGCARLFTVGTSGSHAGQRVVPVAAPANPFNFDAPAAPAPAQRPPSANGTRPKPGSANGAARRPMPAAQPRPRDRSMPVGVLIVGGLALLMGAAGAAIAPLADIGIAGAGVAGLGLLLGIGGFFAGLRRPVVGTLVCSLAVLVCLAAVPFAGYQTFKQLTNDLASDVAKTGDSGAKEGSDSSAPAGAQPKAEPTPPAVEAPAANDQWRDASRGVRLEGAQVRVTAVDVDFIRGSDPRNVTRDKGLQVRVEVRNVGSKPLNYAGWGFAEPKIGDAWPTLTDNNGNAYRRMMFDAGQVAGQVKGATLQPGKSLEDLLIFEVPPESVAYLRLELSGANLEATGKVRLQIGKDQLVNKSTPKEPRGPAVNSEVANRIEANRKLLHSPQAPERIAGATELGNMGAAAAPAVADLVPLLKDRIDEVRRVAAEALGKIGPGARSAVPALTAALRDEFWRVQAAAARALGAIGPEARSALPELERLTKSKDEEVPEMAAEAIRRIDPRARASK